MKAAMTASLKKVKHKIVLLEAEHQHLMKELNRLGHDLARADRMSKEMGTSLRTNQVRIISLLIFKCFGEEAGKRFQGELETYLEHMPLPTIEEHQKYPFTNLRPILDGVLKLKTFKRLKRSRIAQVRKAYGLAHKRVEKTRADLKILKARAHGMGG